MADRLTFALRDWRGPSGVTLIQGVKWDGSRFLIGQADDVGTAVEDVVLREHAADLSYTGRSQTLKQAGHGSSFGVEAVAGGTRVWIGHKSLGVGYYLFGESLFTPTPGVPNGDVAVDQANDLLCVRVGNRYRGYFLSAVENGKAVTLFDQSIPAWGKRFQGHSITRLSDGNVYVLVHRDVKTLGDSRADWFKCLNGKLYAAGSINTTKMGDEAEGFLLYDGSVWITKRHGGNNAGRTVLATRTHLKLLNPEVDTVIHESSKNWSASVRAAALEVDKKYPRHEWTSTYPGHGENSAKGAYAVDFMCNKSDGDKIAKYVWANRKRLGVRYVIWDRRIISETKAPYGKWVRYFNAGSPNPSKNHTNHVHVSFYTNRSYSPPKGVIGQVVDKVVGIIRPKPAARLPLISLKAVQAALRSGAELKPGVDGAQYQATLNKFNPVYKLKVDGVLGQNSRRATALAQLKVAQSNGNKSLTKDDAWPNKGHNADLDGIPGGELFKAMNLDNSDDNAVKA